MLALREQVECLPEEPVRIGRCVPKGGSVRGPTVVRARPGRRARDPGVGGPGTTAVHQGRCELK